MGIYQHVETFAGRPVVDYRGDQPVPEPDGPVAWRVSYWDDDFTEGLSDGFRDHFAEFLSRVDPATVDALVIGSWGYAAFKTPPIGQLREAASQLTGLRALFLGDILGDECEISWIKQDDVTPLLAAYPALEVLRLRGTDGLELDVMHHPALKELAIESGGLPADIVRRVGECDFPAMQHLELWLGVSYYGGDATADDLAAILAGTRLPALRHLGLRNAEIADQLATAVAAAPVVARLSTLDMSLGILSDTGAEALLAGQPLTHLRRLDLHHHYLSDDMMARVHADLPGVDVDLSDQESEDEGERYTAVSE